MHKNYSLKKIKMSIENRKFGEALQSQLDLNELIDKYILSKQMKPKKREHYYSYDPTEAKITRDSVRKIKS